MRRTMISLRGFQAPRTSDRRLSQRQRGSAGSKRQRSPSRPSSSHAHSSNNAQLAEAAPATTSVFLQAVQQQQSGSLTEATPLLTSEAEDGDDVPPPPPPLLAMGLEQQQQEEAPEMKDGAAAPAGDEQPLFAEDEDALAREVEEDCRMSEDLPFTPHDVMGSYPQSSPLPEDIPAEGDDASGAPAIDGDVDGSGLSPTTTTSAPFTAFWNSLASSSSHLNPPSPAEAAAGAAEEELGGGVWGGKRRTTFTLNAAAPSAAAAATTAPPSMTTALGVICGDSVSDASASAVEAPSNSPPPPPPPPQQQNAVDGDVGAMSAMVMDNAPLPSDEGSTSVSKPLRTRFVLGSAVPAQEAANGPSTPPSPQPALMLPLAPSPPVEMDADASPCGAKENHAATNTTDSPSPSSSSWYGLAADVGLFFKARRGITQLYPWQHDVLTREDVLAGKSLAYSLPTSGGKTLVAEVTLLRCVLNRGKSALFVVPFVSLAEEKTMGLKPFGEAFDFTVDGHYGSTGRFPLPPGPALYVCTIEKANSVLNHMLEEGRGDELGAVVVDELHMLGEPRRGATLELFLSKLLTYSAERSPIQIIGMSATIPNLPVLAGWLQAACYEGDYRPVPLRQYSVVDGQVLLDGTTNVRNLCSKSEAEQLFELATEVSDGSILIFCASRQQCVDTARGLARYLQRTVTTANGSECALIGASVTTPIRGCLAPRATGPLKVLVEELRGLSHSDASQLAEVVPFGIAFHHGGLLVEERDLIESAYRSKHLRVLCCTSTLAAGVNLPACRVVFKTPFIGRDFLTKSRYLQMCGRAGRAGLDAYGESFLILSRRDRERGHRLMRQELEPCVSQMLEDVSQLPRSLLESVSVGLVLSEGGVRMWGERLLARWAMGPIDAPLQSCLAEETDHDGSINANSNSVPPPDTTASRSPQEILSILLKESLRSLTAQKLITATPTTGPSVPSSAVADPNMNEDDSNNNSMSGQQGDQEEGLRLQATPFGVSSIRSCFTVEEAILVRDELQHLQETGLILSDDLHLCYFLTPLREVGDCDWGIFRHLLSRLSDGRQRIAEMLGVNERFVDQRAMGLGGPAHTVPFTEDGKRDFFVARRFFVAMILSDVLAEVPLNEVEQRYSVHRGQLQSLMRSASMFSSSITSFCHAMEWYALEAVLSSFVKRLGFGVKPDLVPLMELRGVQPSRARALWNAGMRTPAAIAACDPDEMVTKVKAMNPVDAKAAKFFTKRSALMLIREAHLLLQHQISEKRGELYMLTGRPSTNARARR